MYVSLLIRKTHEVNNEMLNTSLTLILSGPLDRKLFMHYNLFVYGVCSALYLTLCE